MNSSSISAETFQSISRTSLKILRQQSTSIDEWQNLFHIVHEACLWHEVDAQIYESLERNTVLANQSTLAQLSLPSADDVFVKTYIDAWKKHMTQSVYLARPFGRLRNYNQTWNDASKSYNIGDLVKKTWHETVFAKLKPRVQKSVTKLIENERNGKVCDPWLIVGVRDTYLDTCEDLSIYFEFFEKVYFDDTRSFYLVAAPEYMVVNGVFEYMKYAELKIAEEVGRADKYLDKSSHEELKKLCVDVLVSPFLEAILAECGGMIDRNEVANLARMRRLLLLVPNGVAPVLDELEKYVVGVGLADVVAAAETIVQDSEKYVQRLLDLFERFSELIKEGFQGDPRFVTCRDKAFKIIINDTSLFELEFPTKKKRMTPAESKCPELLANFCDSLLRKTQISKKLTNENVEIKLRGVLLLLNYVENKDVFMIHYKSHLTRRLLLDTSVDGEMEESMVTWLRKVGVPAEYIDRVARMFSDIKVSRDFNRLFKEKFVQHSFDVKILNSAAWSRNDDKISVSLPMELEDYTRDVEKFYQKQHGGGRKLIWHHRMANGTITFNNAVGTFDLDVTTFQMAVLFAWNERPYDRISFDNLKLATGLPDSELKKTVWSLVSMPMAKRKIVKCHPEVKLPLELTNETEFWINDDFGLVRNGKVEKRGKINLIGRLQFSTEKCQRGDNEAVVQLREFRLQEAIVRIAKARQNVDGDQLQSELVGILRNMFVPTKRMIKEQIEFLIEKEYLGRDKQEFSKLFYIA